MNFKSTGSNRILGLVLALTGPGYDGLAQPQTPPAASDEVVELSPFVVDTTKDVGYLAGNTLAGTRLNQSLKDTAASVSVFTPEFLADIGALNLTDAVQYAVNVEMQLDDDRAATNGNETVNEYQKYRVRGMPASVTRNYFDWNLPTSTYNVERIEDSRGPNSVLFGIGSPGGIINSATKQALLGRAFHKASASYGSFASWRTAIDLNQPLIQKKLALRLNAVWDQNNSFRHWAGEESRRAHLAATYAFTRNTQVRAEFERGQINDNSPRTYNLTGNIALWTDSGRPTFNPSAYSSSLSAVGVGRQSTSTSSPRVTYISDLDKVFTMSGTLTTTGPAGSAVITDHRFTDDSINFGGPAQDRFGRFTTYFALVEHQFSKNTALNVGYNHQEMNVQSYDPRTNGNTIQGDPANQLADGSPNPEAGRLYLETSWFKTPVDRSYDIGRAIFSTGYDAGKWGDYRAVAYTEYIRSSLFSVSYNETWVDAATGRAAFNATPDNGANYVYRRSYPIERDWATYYVNGPGPSGLLQNYYDPVSRKTLNTVWGIPRSRPKQTYTNQGGGMIALQASYFKNRLILGGGLRRDEYREHTLATYRDQTTLMYKIAATDADHAGATGLTEATFAKTVARNKTLGAVLHATRNVSFYYNQSDNIQLPPRGQDVFTDAGTPGVFEPAPAPKGRGRDFGMGVDLLAGRLYARGTYYTTAARGLSTTFNTGTGSSVINVPDAQGRIMNAVLAANLVTQAEYDLRRDMPGYEKYDQSSSGYEFQLIANLTQHWRLQANYSYADAVEENKLNEVVAWAAQNEAWLSSLHIPDTVKTSSNYTIPQEIANYHTGIDEVTASNGIQKLGNRHEKVSLFTKYNFSMGRLKGLAVGGGYRFQSKIYTGQDSLGNRVYGPSYWRTDAMLGYRWRGFEPIRNINFQLNVLNVLDQHDPLITRYIDLATGPALRTVVQAPRTWRFTTEFEF